MPTEAQKGYDNGIEPANPTLYGQNHVGLTKREYFAGVIMAGLAANPNPGSMYKIAVLAAKGADELLIELSKQP